MYLNVSLLTFVLALTVVPCRAQPQIMFPDEAESRLLSRSSPDPVSKPDGEDIDTDDDSIEADQEEPSNDDRSQRHFLFSRQRDSSRLHNAKPIQFEEFFEPPPPATKAPANNQINSENNTKQFDKDCELYNVCRDRRPNYPSKKMVRAVKRAGKVTQRLIKSLITPPAAAVDNSVQGRSDFIQPRIAGAVNMETNVCNTIRQQITPQEAKNTQGKFMWILNQPEGNAEYVQTVDTTICDQENGSECHAGMFSGFQTRCKQEYTEHKLLALDEDGEQIVIDTFRFPSCCTCQINKSLEH